MTCRNRFIGDGQDSFRFVSHCSYRVDGLSKESLSHVSPQAYVYQRAALKQRLPSCRNEHQNCGRERYPLSNPQGSSIFNC